MGDYRVGHTRRPRGNAMGILERLGTVIRSNLQALDGPREPNARVDAWITEMERTLREARQERIRLRAEAKRRLSSAARAEEEAASWEERAALALREAEEAMARDALRQKLRAQRRAEALRTEAAQLQAEEARAETLITHAEAKLRDLRTRRPPLVTALQRGESRLSAPASPALQGLEEVTERIDVAEAELELERFLDDGTAELQARFETLQARAHERDLEADVAALKARLGGPKEGT